MPTVAFLGLGSIGRPIARRIAEAKHSLTVWNRTADRATAFTRDNSGITAAKSAADAVQNADVVAICLSTSQDVDQVLQAGVEGAIKSGAVVLDLTSGDPATSRRIAQRLKKRNIEFIDAPVSGGVKGAEAGTLTVMCGGEAKALERVRPLIESFG